ncbi:MAG: serine/threonine protein kinase, partial [Elusimicrobiales bacterium]|nr:serine/threonine protein kinase [Elusimicrobiales bacterium]
MIYQIKNIENIEIIREIGSGGMGVVYEGYDTVLDRRVAVKMMLPNMITPQGKKRFLKEAAIMAKINHPAAVNVYSFGEIEINEKRVPYFVMEYVDGKSLAELITRLKILKNSKPEELEEYGYITHTKSYGGYYFLKDFIKVPIEEKEWIENSSNLISNIADALYEIHKEGVIHRDIKPSNILISKKGPKIADFGLVKNISSNSISTQTDFVGTIKYSAPEIFSKGKHSIQSDIYSLGVVFYELLTLVHPFEFSQEDSPAYIMGRIIKSEIKPPHLLNKAIPEQLSKVILKMLASSPKDRFSSMKEVSESIMLSKQSQIEKIITDIASIFKKENIEISQSDKEISNEKLKLALKSYTLLDFSEALFLINDSIHFNYFNIDAYLLAMLISLHGNIFPKNIREKFDEVKKYFKNFDHVTLEKAKILDLYLSKDRRWIDYAISFAKSNSNFMLYHIIARERKDLAEFFLKKAQNEFPEFADFSKLLLDIYSNKGNIDIKSIERLKDKPNIDLLVRVIIIERYLWELYDIEKAENEIIEVEKKYPYNYSMLIYRLYLDIIKCDDERFLIDINKIISVIPDDMKFGFYLLLYYFYFRKKEFDKAERYYRIAKNLGVKDIKTLEDIQIETKNPDYSVFENSDKKVIEFSYSLFLNDFINYFLEAELMWFFKVNTKIVVLNENNDVHFYYISSKPSGRIDFIPLGNFYDLKGNILKAKYRQISQNSYFVEVEEGEE